MAHAPGPAASSPSEFWEERYTTHRRESGQVWSGEVNAAVAREVEGLTPDTALDLGCGEGGDALWLGAHGWTVTAVDISSTALGVARTRAEQLELDDRIDWIRADLASWNPTVEYDLVTAAFLHSPVELARETILRRAAAAVAPGGTLLVVGHGAFPPGSDHEHDADAPPLPTPDEVLDALELPDGWVVETRAMVDRRATGRDGAEATLTDAVVRVRRA
ncbi:SAM-dependent methyltransferase [Microbacterium sp. CJ88]|uniref:SAM-dependent methyltransferase n=1 Tax=Microbacterium sp. CJ88 TaxID=3445672 RepID=UPI003F65540D